MLLLLSIPPGTSMSGWPHFSKSIGLRITEGIPAPLLSYRSTAKVCLVHGYQGEGAALLLEAFYFYPAEASAPFSSICQSLRLRLSFSPGRREAQPYSGGKHYCAGVTGRPGLVGKAEFSGYLC